MNQSAFSTSYTSARAHFRNAVIAIPGSQLDAVAYPERGPTREELTTEVAWIGPRDARRVLVTASGTHGVEGFCGSGAQIAWLEQYTPEELPPDTAVMMIHAINPFGFAWRRRVTHENVDLNRNWVDFSTVADRNREYDEIAEDLCPVDWSEESQARTGKVLLARMGQSKESGARFAQVVSGGQHRYQDGLFYGGTSETVARRNLAAILQGRLGHAEHVAIIDFHSGLGECGKGELIAASLLGTSDFTRARSWFGASINPIGTQGADFAKISGDWLTAVPQLLPHATVTAIAVEFGTVSTLEVLQALRADNWLHNHGDRNGPLAEEIRAQMTSAFYVDEDRWREMIVRQSLLVCRQALAGLADRPAFLQVQADDH